MLVDSENRKEQNMNDWQDVEQELSAEMLNAIRQGMQEKGISLTILADMSGVSLETVERLESGRRM